jgi:DNA-binding helix-hairpin-helix protein with protein kinase domain
MGDPFDPTDPHAEPPPLDPTARRLSEGARLWNQLSQLDSAGKALLAISGLEEEDLRAVATHLIFYWHHTYKSPDDYSAWTAKDQPGPSLPPAEIERREEREAHEAELAEFIADSAIPGLRRMDWKREPVRGVLPACANCVHRSQAEDRAPGEPIHRDKWDEPTIPWRRGVG